MDESKPARCSDGMGSLSPGIAQIRTALFAQPLTRRSTVDRRWDRRGEDVSSVDLQEETSGSGTLITVFCIFRRGRFAAGFGPPGPKFNNAERLAVSTVPIGGSGPQVPGMKAF